jgi:sugar phosphate isomerase/epimerase
MAGKRFAADRGSVALWTPDQSPEETFLMNYFSRRKLLRDSVMGSTAALLGEALPGLGIWPGAQKPSVSGPDVKFPGPPRQRLAVASWPFRSYIESLENEHRDRSEPGMDVREFAAGVLKEFGVPGVEPLSSHFSSTDERYLKSFRARIEEAGVHVVNVPVDNTKSYFDADPSVRKKILANGKRWVDVARMIGSPSVRTSIAPAENAKPDAEVVAEGLLRLADYAAAKNIVVNLENDNLLSEDAFFLVSVIEKVNNPYVRALPDFCNSMASGSEKFNYEAVTAMFQHAYNICHVKDSELTDDGKVIRVDLKKTFEILKASHYRGYCSMEWEGGGSPYDGTRKLIAASLEYLA